MYFDAHAHYEDEQYNEDRYELIESMHANGVDFIINSGSSVETSISSLELAERYKFIYAVVGVHPEAVGNMTEAVLEQIREMSRHSKAVGIGEIGLDYHYEDNPPKDVQQHWFKRQLEIAYEEDLPVVIHSRDAQQDTFDIIKASPVRRGLIHAFSGSSEMAKQYIELGFKISVGGVVTFKNAQKLVKVVENTDLSQILLETDSPYLSPTPLRGKRNNSQNIKYIAEKIGEIKQISPEIVAKETSRNAFDLFLQKKVVA
jgi:TatD DNase family protein